MYLPIDDRKFEWIKDVDEILSKASLEIRIHGNKTISYYDVVLAHLSSNLSLLYAISESKVILNEYRKSMERIATAIKRIHFEIFRLQRAKKIIIDNKPYFILEDNTIFSESDINLMEEARYNLQEAFRQLGRAFIYILVSAIEPYINTGGSDSEEQQNKLVQPDYNVPLVAPAFYMPPTQPTQQQFNQQNQNQGVQQK